MSNKIYNGGLAQSNFQFEDIKLKVTIAITDIRFDKDPIFSRDLNS
jgi:hypothetical protein